MAVFARLAIKVGGTAFNRNEWPIVGLMALKVAFDNDI